MRVPHTSISLTLAAGLLALGADARADLVEDCADAAEAAQSLRDANRLVEARRALLACAKQDCPRIVRDDCRSWLAEVDAAMPSIVIVVDDEKGRPVAGGTLAIDGSISRGLEGTAIPLDPGTHGIALTVEGYERHAETVVIRTGEKNRAIRVVLRRQQKPSPPPVHPRSKTLPYVLIGAGAVALGAGLYLGLDARSDVDDMRSSCAPHCDAARVDRARTQLLMADVAMGAGLVSAGVGAWLLFAGEQDSPVVIGADAASVGATWRGRFW